MNWIMGTNPLLSDTTNTVRLIESITVKEGVVCDVYSFDDSQTCDLGRITIKGGHKTPTQFIAKGFRTVERHISGQAELRVKDPRGRLKTYKYPNFLGYAETEVKPGHTIQWVASGDETIVIEEICWLEF